MDFRVIVAKSKRLPLSKWARKERHPVLGVSQYDRLTYYYNDKCALLSLQQQQQHTTHIRDELTVTSLLDSL